MSIITGALVVVCFFGLPLKRWYVGPGASIAMWMGGAILLFLFLPRLGHVRIDPQTREIEFRDSFTAALLHPWYGRVRKCAILTPGSVVLVGSWPGKDAGSPQWGIRVAPEGQSMILLTDLYQMSGRTALQVTEALSQLEGVQVKLVCVGADSQPMAWVPRGSANPWVTFMVMAKFGLVGVGWVAAMLGLATKSLLLLGGASAVVYAACSWGVFAFSKPADSDDRKFGAISLAFGVIQFVLLYTVLILVGTNMGGRPPR
jgi:hypothetical protein